jgi:hypothetical protein
VSSLLRFNVSNSKYRHSCHRVEFGDVK